MANNLRPLKALYTSAKEEKWEEVKEGLKVASGNIDLSRLEEKENGKTVKTVLHYACETPNEGEVEPTVNDLLSLLKPRLPEIEYLKFINKKDKSGNTALEIATKRRIRGAVKLLIKNGADICKLKQKVFKLNEDTDAMQRVFDPVYNSLFDESFTITKNDEDLENELLWHVDCNNFEPLYEIHDPPIPQTRNLAIILRRKIATESVIMKHPLVQIFLHFKKEKFSKWLYFTMVYQLIWSFLSFVFIFCNTHIRDSRKIDGIIIESNLTQFCKPFRIYEQGSIVQMPYFAIMLIFLMVAIVKELFEITLYPNKLYYAKQLENWGQWIVIIIVAFAWYVAATKSGGVDNRVINLNVADTTEQVWMVHLRPAVFLLGMFSSLVLVQFQLAKFKVLGVYNEMFGSALLSILKFILAFFPLLLAFLLILHILLPMRPEFEPQWGLGFPKVLAMMTGEVDYNNILFGKDTDDIAFRNILKVCLLIFIVVVVVLLQNFLVGLTVSDVQKLEQTATVEHLASTVEDIYLLEHVMVSLRRHLKLKDKWPAADNWIETYMLRSNDLEMFDKYKEQTINKRLKDYPPNLRNAIIQWHSEQPACISRHSSQISLSKSSSNGPNVTRNLSSSSNGSSSSV